jgi:carbonic anhydrase
VFEDLLTANRRYASTFSLRGLAARARMEMAVVTCMDSRIEPLVLLGLSPGDAKILRNGGGRVTEDVLRSLVLATNLLGVRWIAVMQHTDCALSGRSDESVRCDLPSDYERAARSWEFLAMPDPDEALTHDVERVRRCELLPADVRVEGWRYSVETGLVDRLVRA